MTAQRQYERATIFNARIVIMNHLWTPSDMYKGKKQEKPSWFAGFIVQKTRQAWNEEPALSEVTAALGKLWQANNHIISWPIVDGDLPNIETGKHSEWAKGHWLFNASTNSSPPSVEMVTGNGQLVKLTNRTGVKSGDYVIVAVTAAQKQNDPRAAKLFLNAVVFSAPGEEIVVGNSVSGAELMAQAQAQGLRPTGFTSSPGGFGGAPAGGGFNPGGAGGFTPPNGGHPGSPSPGGFAPTPGGPASPGPAGAAFGTTGPGNGSAFPSNGAGPAAPRGPFG